MNRLTDLIIAILATATAFLLSWPFWRDFSYWAESHTAWYAYFVIGFILGIYVLVVFIGSLRILFQHARDEARANTARPTGNGRDQA